MTRLFTEGFENRYNANQPWLNYNNTNGVEAVNWGHGSGWSLKSAWPDMLNAAGDPPPGASTPPNTFPSSTTDIYVRTAILAVTYPQTIGNIIVYGDNGPELTIRFSANGGPIRVYTHTNPLDARDRTLIASGTTPLTYNQWYLVEFHYVLGNPGVIEVKVEGTLEISASIYNTAPRGSVEIDKVTWQGETVLIDDVAVNDTSGGVDDTWPGDGRIIMLRPNGAVSDDWDLVVGGSSGITDNYQGASKPDVTESGQLRLSSPYDYYVKSPDSGDTDWYNVTTLTLEPGDVITRIWASGIAAEAVANGDSVDLGLKINGTPSWTTSQPLTTFWKVHEGDSQLVNWDQSDQSIIDGLQIGVKVP